MYVDYTKEQSELRDELREYFADLMTPERRRGASAFEGGEMYREVIRQMGTDRWLGVGFPKELGGRGFGPCEQLIFYDELRRAGAPFPFVTLSTVAPTLQNLGTEEQRKRFVPSILAGECHFAIGYTEPEAGTDLASLKTSAVRHGDHWVINGQKVFTSGANDADFIWLACRTDPEAPKHKGISIIIVPTDQAGFEWGPIHTVAGNTTCVTHYSDAVAPAEWVVGGVNNGWKLITTQLNHERIGLSAMAGITGMHVEQVARWAAETIADDGRPLIEQPFASMALAEATCLYEAIKVMNWRVAWEMERGIVNPANASMVKVFGSESAIAIYRLLLDVVGSAGIVREGSPGAILGGALEFNYRQFQINTFGGGVNEIQREIISMTGLGMPRVPR
jgi:alkylation response protein AidB-like acyl-CoA dehydrogenase